MRRKAVSLLLVAMMMSVAVPVHASEQATVTIQESQGENREIDQVQSSETTESKSSTSQITTTAVDTELELLDVVRLQWLCVSAR